ncbi:NifB/NifX family molybdenum-iron cluster-binding protein [Thermococcus sp.]|uniref:NifB/NifX family molybdenum-iron cluster-binding protein n=1 Tax=Thermococcus sp. TaxID=35749 RepID=UPI0025D8390C|nr:NifB/NifX family molybdenum-iron cluster-binding protein [Thermococcus sp.]
MVKTLVAIPTSKGGLDDEVHESLVRAETFTLVEFEEGEVKGVKVIENPYKREPYGAGSKVALFLVNLGVNAIISRTDCPKGKMILDSAGVKMVIVDDAIKVEDALRGLR